MLFCCRCRLSTVQACSLVSCSCTTGRPFRSASQASCCHHSRCCSWDCSPTKWGKHSLAPLTPTRHVVQSAAAATAAVLNCCLLGLFPGELQLHYSETIPECLSGFLLPPDEMMKRMESSTQWKQQPPLSDAEITATATRLGLLPVRPPKAAGEIEPDCSPLH
jgi:hypothetical protein